jgi:hypothetical protein
MQCACTFFAIAFAFIARYVGVAPSALESVESFYAPTFIILVGVITALALFNITLFRPLSFVAAVKALLALSQPLFFAVAAASVMAGLDYGRVDISELSHLGEAMLGRAEVPFEQITLAVGVVVSVPAFALASALPHSATPFRWWFELDGGDGSAVLIRRGYLQLLPLLLLALLQFCHGTTNVAVSNVARACLNSNWTPFVIAFLLVLPTFAVIRRARRTFTVLSSD